MKLESKLDTDVVLELSEAKGAHCEEHLKNTKIGDDLLSKLVPFEGEPDSIHGELINAAQYIYGDVYNNGGYNLSYNIHGDELEEGDDGWQKPEYELHDCCEKHIAALEKWLPSEHQESVAQVKAFILSEDLDTDIMLDHLIDRVIHTILTTRNIVQEKSGA